MTDPSDKSIIERLKERKLVDWTLAYGQSRQGRSVGRMALLWIASLPLVGCGVATDAPAEAAAPRPRGLVLRDDRSAEGYVYFSSLVGSTTYLIETATGQVVHTWPSDYAPSGGIYLLDNGNLMRTAQEPDVTPFSAGGQGGRIQEITWDGQVVWDYLYASPDHLLHHDIEILPNGNILAIAWETKSREETQEMGYRPEMTPERGLWPDVVIELEPQPLNGARIVWEWHSWDHLIQNRDPSLGTYGELADHPERIDINGNRQPPDSLSTEDITRYRELGFVPADDQHDPSSDLMHMNAIAYNADLDQIALSVNRYSEIWIIDHSTTTEQGPSCSHDWSASQPGP